ncbi:ATP-binding protein [Streptosporangium vulgare]|uniref:ATP-binding protein n=1 Tax=Streptosporangium vulgare TaxID=46190 RepID=A0ABV5TDZ2_9ACTN
MGELVPDTATYRACDHRPSTGGRNTHPGDRSAMHRGKWGYASPEEWLRVPGPMVWRRTFPGTPQQVSEARHFVEGLFAGTPRSDDAGTIAAELCNNAVLHTVSGHDDGWFGVEVVLDDLAYLAVTDLGGAGRPVLTSAAGGKLVEGGFGILLVKELALTIGVHGSPQLGHTVWADIDLTLKIETAQEGQGVAVA